MHKEKVSERAPALRTDQPLSPLLQEQAVEIQAFSASLSDRAHTELARVVGKRAGWRFVGSTIIDTEGYVVAPSLEDAARGMHELGWITGGDQGIDWTIADLHDHDPRPLVNPEFGLAVASVLRRHLEG